MGTPQTGYKAKTVEKSKNRKRFWLTVCAVGMLNFIIFTLITYSFITRLDAAKLDKKDIQIDPDKKIAVEIPLGSNTSEIAKILKQNNVIQSELVFKMLSKIAGFDGTYQSGTHYVKKGLKFNELMSVLSGKPESIRVTIPEGYSYKQIVDTLASKGLINKDTFNKIAKEKDFDFDFLKDVNPNRDNRLEGYLFPDTYEFDPKAGEEQIITRMLERFEQVFNSYYRSRAKKMNRSIDEIITLASIVEREAKLDEDRPMIAGVFYNRLKSKDKNLSKLQSCATVQYVLMKQQGITKEKLTNLDLKIEDSYNTYLHKGLPPGPICSPGKSSIEAALNPDVHDYYFFELDTDGSGKHVFSK